MGTAKRQTIIKNLMKKCEERCQKSNKHDWRLEQYLKMLSEMLDEEMIDGKLSDELYVTKKKVEFYQGLLEARSKESLLDQYTSISLLAPVFENVDLSCDLNISNTKTIHKMEVNKYNRSIREQLFQTSKETENEKSYSGQNHKDIVKYHKLLQEQVTNEMVILSNNLKHNCAVSSEIVKKDNELLEKANTFVDKTMSNLKVNTSTIKEYTNRACEYWLWISLFLVTITFLFMVVFIRLFPKKNIVYVYNKEKTEL